MTGECDWWVGGKSGWVQGGKRRTRGGGRIAGFLGGSAAVWFSFPDIKPNATFHWFTCRRALLALYFSCKEWCWFRCPGRCRCYSLHLGKGLGWDRAFGSLKCWTETLFSLWPRGDEGKKARGTMQNAKKVPHLRGSLSFCLLIPHKSLP